MVQKSNEDNSSNENDFEEEFENEEGIHRSSQTGIEDEANEQEKDLKSFSSSELTNWEQERDSKVDNKKNKDDSELSNDTVRMYLKEIGKVNLLSASDEVILARSIETSICLKKLMAMPSEFSEEAIDYSSDFFNNHELNAFVINNTLSRFSELSKLIKSLKKFLNIKGTIKFSDLVVNDQVKEIIDGQKVDEIFMEATKYISDTVGIPLEDAESQLIELSVLRRIIPENYVMSSDVDLEKQIRNQSKIIEEITKNSIRIHLKIIKFKIK